MKEGSAFLHAEESPRPAGRMRILRQPDELRALGAPICAAVGFFDGVHLGHQAVLARACSDARELRGLPVAVTFDRHPGSVLAPARAPRLVYPLERRLQALEDCGMGAALLLHFDLEFSRVEAREFIQRLVSGCGSLHSISVGVNFGFGHKRSGDLALLQSMARDLGFGLHGLPRVLFSGDPVSSTRVRDTIQRGDFELAGGLLGRPYGLAGLVVQGDQRGRMMGFPTANLDVSGLATPPVGVYAARALLDGRTHPAVVNIGRRPTVAGPDAPVSVEAHLLDFSQDVYGRRMELVFASKLRDEIRFPGLPELKARIQEDIHSARRFFE